MSYACGNTNTIELFKPVGTTFHRDLCSTTQECDGFAESMMVVWKNSTGFKCRRACAEPLCSTSSTDEIPKQ